MVQDLLRDERVLLGDLWTRDGEFAGDVRAGLVLGRYGRSAGDLVQEETVLWGGFFPVAKRTISGD